jgi:RimJ/RimL family protein N-acetyltransferase
MSTIDSGFMPCTGASAERTRTRDRHDIGGAAPLRLAERIRRWLRYRRAMSVLRSLDAETRQDLWLHHGDFHAVAGAFARGERYRPIGTLSLRCLTRDDLASCLRFAASLSMADIRSRFGRAIDLTDASLCASYLLGPDDVLTFAYVDLLGDVLAVGHLAPVSDTSAEVAVIVGPDYRNKTLGGGMISGMARYARQHGLAELIACIEWSNPPAVRMLRRLGFASDAPRQIVRQTFRKHLV